MLPSTNFEHFKRSTAFWFGFSTFVTIYLEHLFQKPCPIKSALFPCPCHCHWRLRIVSKLYWYCAFDSVFFFIVRWTIFSPSIFFQCDCARDAFYFILFHFFGWFCFDLLLFSCHCHADTLQICNTHSNVKHNTFVLQNVNFFF